MKDENKLYWIWLSQRFGAASKSFPSFADKLDDPYDIYRLETEEIEQIEGISQRLKEKLADKSLDEAYTILKYCKNHDIDIIGYSDKRYPARLRVIEDPPVMLYCKGKLPDMNGRLCLGVVGTRKMSEYGKRSAYKISYELGAANVCVVSGMALGVDAVAACGALEAGGSTVAVLGCGLSTAYPKEHTDLMKRIISKGAVISEFPPFERPFGGNFPKRNRIISGLCQGVLVVEGSSGSGSLITASRAISQGREVFALPGEVGVSNSEGPNELIKNGAYVALSATDIVTHYDFLYHDVINYGKLSKAKTRSELDEKTLAAYGICLERRGGFKGRVVPKDDSENIELPTFSELGFGAEDNAVKNAPTPSDSDEERIKKILSGLDAHTASVYALLPDGTFTPDSLASCGIDIGDAVMSLTMLEIADLITALPGGMYTKK